MFSLPGLLVGVPILVGLAVALVNKDWANGAVERMDAWIRSVKVAIAENDHWWVAYVIKPLFWVLVWSSEVSAGLQQRNWRNGVRAWAILLVSGLWFIIVCYAAAVALVVGACYLLVRLLVGVREERSTAGEHHTRTTDERRATQALQNLDIPKGGWHSAR